ncbi:GTP-binding protein [bacterium]|nr:GTP-binding protein [bacterium]|tara:strand:- start:3000 stop:3542 length:543 start_codon:yes stop_codon:yes gene_type:complete
MGTQSPFTKVQLFTGMIYDASMSTSDLFNIVEAPFKASIDSFSDTFDFNHSSYYTAEMGFPLKRLFVSFDRLVSPESAYQYKEISNRIESQFMTHNKRHVNIDPGILSLHNILLFSTKNFSHRIACGQGIYTELTLLYQKGCFKSLDWTYPDFKHSKIQHYFLSLRKRYHTKLQSGDTSS